MRRLILFLLIADAALAQAPTFDVASIKPNRGVTASRDVDHNGGALTMRNVSLKFCIMQAYNVKDGQVFGPGWIETEKFDITAKGPADTVRDEYRLRLRSLLAERFKLAVHRETRENAVYALVVAKNGPKIQRDETAATDSGATSRQRGVTVFKSVTMAHLARFLERASVGLPVMDKTGLEGVYSFTLRYKPEAAADGAGDDWPPLLVALQEQLGLKLESRKVAVEVVVVDRAERTPMEN